jgi:outer membrane protein
MGRWTILVLAAALIPAAAHAATADDDEEDDAPPPKWTVEIGAKLLATPVFPGSNNLSLLPLPAGAIRYRDIAYLSDRDGAGVRLWSDDHWELGLAGSLSAGRVRTDHKKALFGLRSVDAAPEIGGFANYAFADNVSASLQVRHAIGGYDGFIAELSADWDIAVKNDRLTLSLGPRLTWHDANYTRAYFGVTPIEALISRYPAYAPGSSWEAGAGVTADFALTEHLNLQAYADYYRLMGDAADSPIVTGPYGSRGQLTLGTSLTWRFAWGR